MIPVGVACSCLVVSYLCVYATGKGRVRVSVCGGVRARATHRPEHSPSLDTNFLSNATGNRRV